MGNKSKFVLLLLYTAAAKLHATNGSPIPDTPLNILSNYCLNCHDEVEMKGDVNLDHLSVDWTRGENLELWERVLHMAEEGKMPPEEKRQPSVEERATLVAWLDETLRKHTPIGGTLPRRLSQAEYRATIQDLFGLPEFELPLGFPKDSEYHGFNNVGEGLVLSPPLMEAYAKVAQQIAEQVYPPEGSAPKHSIRSAGPEDMVLSFSAATVVGDVLRLASRSETIMRSCTWPSRIEIMASGTYRITISASTFRPKTDEPMKLELRARELTASDRSNVNTFRLLEAFEFSSYSPQTYTFEADLYEGQTVLLRWSNAEMTHEFNALADQLGAWFERDPRLLASWQKTVFPDGDLSETRISQLRGKNGWDIVTRNLADPDLDMSQATMDSETTKALMKIVRSLQGTYSVADAMCHYYFQNGPSLQFHGITVEGPIKIVDGPKEKLSKKLRERFTGVRKPDQSDEDFAGQILERFLPQAFRRPVDRLSVDTFLSIAKQHWAEGNSFDEGMHLLIRSILISPRFLYRSLDPTEMDDYDLASRLSYFMTRSPPDTQLVKLAQNGRLSDPEVLGGEALRLLPDSPSDAMVQSFTSHWLDTKLLPEIMPDPVFDFSEAEIATAKSEVEHFFAAMLRDNLPMTDFIDPDFTYTSLKFAKENYHYVHSGNSEVDTEFEKEDSQIGRLPMPRGGRFGGLLGQSAIMMATANGVDTQPVLRGVWVLENILGTPPPEPPQNVPALTPDIRGAKTPREMLAAHMDDKACSTCHSRIDPLGLMLENFDPVGNWREVWPKVNAPIDSAVVLPDGTHINDITDFKAWLVANIDLFSQCLAEKLMIYATGRVPNYSERKEIEGIVQQNHNNSNGFQDLLLALITSETFRTK